MFALAERTIFITLGGSHAHGTAREGSDVDLRGVCIAPLELRVSPFEAFEQYDGPIDASLRGLVDPKLKVHPTAAQAIDVKVEGVVFDVVKFVKLSAAANPNTLEMLFADTRDWLYSTEAWQKLHRERHLFLSQKVQQTYLGYALAQLKRIKTHRSWLLSPPRKKPTRAEFGLPERGTLQKDDRVQIEQSIADRVRSWRLDTLEMPKATRIALNEKMEEFWADTLRVREDELPLLEEATQHAAAASLGLDRDMLEVLKSERGYRAALKHWDSHERWKRERNEARAALEATFGYDTKHAMHLLRLMRTGLEVLETGNLEVRRADASELNAIRDGALSYDEMLAAAEALQARMEDAAKRSPLPADVDRQKLAALCTELVLIST